MAKFNRFNGHLLPFAQNALTEERTVFGSLLESDNIDQNVNTDFLRGFGIYGSLDFPTREDFNGFGFTMSYLTSYLYQQGLPEFNMLQEYNSGSMASHAGGIVVSKEDANIGDDPTLLDKWEKLPASTIGFNNENTEVQATTVQEAIKEISSVTQFATVEEALEGVRDDVIISPATSINSFDLAILNKTGFTRPQIKSSFSESAQTTLIINQLYLTSDIFVSLSVVTGNSNAKINIYRDGINGVEDISTTDIYTPVGVGSVAEMVLLEREDIEFSGNTKVSFVVGFKDGYDIHLRTYGVIIPEINDENHTVSFDKYNTITTTSFVGSAYIEKIDTDLLVAQIGSTTFVLSRNASGVFNVVFEGFTSKGRGIASIGGSNLVSVIPNYTTGSNFVGVKVYKITDSEITLKAGGDFGTPEAINIFDYVNGAQFHGGDPVGGISVRALGETGGFLVASQDADSGAGPFPDETTYKIRLSSFVFNGFTVANPSSSIMLNAKCLTGFAAKEDGLIISNNLSTGCSIRPMSLSSIITGGKSV